VVLSTMEMMNIPGRLVAKRWENVAKRFKLQCFNASKVLIIGLLNIKFNSSSITTIFVENIF